MRFATIGAIALCFACCGCSIKTVVIERIDLVQDKYIGQEKFRLIYEGSKYEGSKKYYHYISICHNGGRKRYKLPDGWLTVIKPHPLKQKQKTILWTSLDVSREEIGQVYPGYHWVLEPFDDKRHRLRFKLRETKPQPHH